MVGGCRGVFYKGIGKELSLTYSLWKKFEVQVGNLLNFFYRFYLL